MFMAESATSAVFTGVAYVFCETACVVIFSFLRMIVCGVPDACFVAVGGASAAPALELSGAPLSCGDP